MLRLIGLVHRYLSKTGSVAFWHTKMSLRPEPRWTQTSYPLSFTAKLAYDGPYDAAGVPQLDYKGATGVQYNPAAVAQYGIGCLQGDGAELLDKARICGDWLGDWAEFRDDGETAWLPYHFAIPEAGLTSPFYSGLAQGLAYSFLIRLAARTGEARYATLATQALRAMVVPVETGGFNRDMGNGNRIIEEFIMDRPSGVLDGWMFSIMALVDEALCEGAEEFAAERAVQISSLKHLLDEYELGYWSRTDLYSDQPKMLASLFYHNLHVLQLTCLADHYGDDTLARVATRWRNYQNNPLCKWRAVAVKVYLKVAKY